VVVVAVAAQYQVGFLVDLLAARHAARLKGVQHQGKISALHPEAGMAQPLQFHHAISSVTYLFDRYTFWEFFMGGTALSRKILENVPVPQIGQEEQEQYVRIVRPLLRIVHRQTEWEESYWSFYRSMLAWAFLGHLSADYRRLHHIEGPDFALLLQHYYVKPETLKLAGVRAADWERSIQEEKRQLLEHLSAFQRAILEGFVESEAPMPVHIIHKQLKSERNPIYKGYSIQDALATVKLLEELGFLEKTLPERLYRNGEELQDFAGKPITIQNYQEMIFLI